MATLSGPWASSWARRWVRSGPAGPVTRRDHRYRGSAVRSGTPRTSQDAARARPDPPSDAAPAVDQGLRCPLPRATPVSALAYQGHDQQSPAARLAYRTAIRGRRDSPARGAPVHDRGAPARVPAFARLRSART